MDQRRLATMMEATRLTREGSLAEATALLQGAQAAARDGASCPTSAYRAFGRKPRCGQCFSFAREIIAAERATA